MGDMYVIQYQNGKYRMSGGGVTATADDPSTARYATYADAFNGRTRDALLSGRMGRIVEVAS